MNPKKEKINLTVFFLYALSFVLLYEWLRPVQQLTDTGEIIVFVIFILIALLLALIKVPFMIRFLIKGIYILYVIHLLYYEGAFFQFGWIGELFKESVANLNLVWNGQLVMLSNAFRTFLFFVLLWLICYLVRYWIIKQKRIFVFFLMTITFITVLDTFSPYQADEAIVRTVITGFTLMGVLTFQRVVQTEDRKNGLQLTRKWIFSLVVMIAGSVAIGYATPKAEPIWPDPVPFIQSFNPGSGFGDEAVGRRAGYGTDDTSLGGPFIGDDSLVFRTMVDDRHYWKVETKEIYTGKGWEVSSMESFDFKADSVPFRSFSNTVPSERMTSTVFNVLNYAHIQYPHGLAKIETDELYWYRINPMTEKITPFHDLEQKTPETYTVHYQKPTFQIDDLQKSRLSMNDYEFEAMKQTYTQLPENLPTRIKQLALEVTKDKETMFDKVQAIESYFRVNSFVYDQVNVAVPDKDEDYVEQFLFETKRGYCDNFSTSMAVMLRTLDIPTRWVKGYTGGDFVETLESGKRIYEVTNNNAHSWVEVFFPKIGWVPFEPTRGFSNDVVFQAVVISSGTEVAEEATAQVQEPQQTVESNTDAKSSASNHNPWVGDVKIQFEKHWKLIFFLLVSSMIVTIIAYLTRIKWLPAFYTQLYRGRKEDDHFPRAYIKLLNQLERTGLPRRQGQTLREYAKEVDSAYGGAEMDELTVQYEHYLYRGTLMEGVWSEKMEVWRELMKKTGA